MQRLCQAQIMEIQIAQSGIPVILAGDFNTSSHDSPVVKRLAEAGFRNAIGEEKVVTSLRGASIDWIFVRGPIRFENGKVHHEIGASDHYPLSVSIHSLSGSQHNPNSKAVLGTSPDFGR
jgi:endonuclease/exonuclease/phosphatase family metal-dependent hydrolase